MKFDKSAEIGPIIASFWRGFSFRKQYQFYGQDCAIINMCDGLKAEGFKKPFFEKKRDFIVNTILAEPSAFRQLCAVVTLSYLDPNSGYRYWLGDGSITMPPNEFIQQFGGVLPSLLLIQINIDSIYPKLQGFLQQTP